MRCNDQGPINQSLDLPEDIRGQRGRYAPIVKYSPVISMLAASDENTRSKALFQSSRQPPYKPTVVCTLWKMEAEDTE
ncbi:hypothetical protein SAMN03159443_00122 [Pseudomonas sp. NFACC15-1]|nr:hypothetical protein SAMN03159443_00122 [Pseudomonas sp. NFACC15-1]SDB32839.1 hypothetical protein SAMN03159290_02399 [Pseudomonas sp. NFACC13-1]SDW23806.1 hypothetical protein SAMN03159380_00286 [Pseudomonas sp. NFACC14]